VKSGGLVLFLLLPVWGLSFFFLFTNTANGSVVVYDT